MAADLTRQLPPRRPWQRQHEEAPADFLRFLGWCFSTTRADIVPETCRELSMTHRWHQRAMLIDSRLRSQPETVEQAASAIAVDAMTILRAELEFKAAQAIEHPGAIRLADLNGLLRLLAELGAFAGKSKGEAEPDYSALTPEEVVILARAGQILARAKAGARA